MSKELREDAQLIELVRQINFLLTGRYVSVNTTSIQKAIDRYAAEREKQARIDELHVIAPLLGLKGDVNADHTLTKGDCWDVLVTRKRELSALKETTK